MKVQGPGSRILKPKKDLCEACNSDRSQSADRALDDFQTLAVGRAKSIPIGMPRIEFVVPEQFQRNLKRWFAKALACYLNRYGARVPNVLRRMFLHADDLHLLSLSVQIDPTLARRPHLENGALFATMSGVDSIALRGLVRQGIVPETIRCVFSFYGVDYVVEVTVPESEVVASAKEAYELALDRELKRSNFPPRVRMLFEWGLKRLPEVIEKMDRFRNRFKSNGRIN